MGISLKPMFVTDQYFAAVGAQIKRQLHSRHAGDSDLRCAIEDVLRDQPVWDAIIDRGVPRIFTIHDVRA